MKRKESGRKQSSMKKIKEEKKKFGKFEEEVT